MDLFNSFYSLQASIDGIINFLNAGSPYKDVEVFIDIFMNRIVRILSITFVSTSSSDG